MPEHEKQQCEKAGCEVWFVAFYRLPKGHQRFCSKRCRYDNRTDVARAKRAKQKRPLEICCHRCIKRVPKKAPLHKYCEECKVIVERDNAREARHRREPGTGVLTCIDCGQETPRKTGTQLRCPDCAEIANNKVKNKTRANERAKRRAARAQSESSSTSA